MKTYKILFASLIALAMASCEEHEVDTAAPLSVGFERSSVNYKVDPADPVYKVALTSTVVSNVDRTYSILLDTAPVSNVVVDGVIVTVGDGDAATTAPAGTFTYPTSITIPAGSYVGYGNVGFDFDLAPAGAPLKVVLDVVTPEGTLRNLTKEQVEINYNQLCILTEAELKFTFDQYPEETYFELYDGDFNVIAQGGQGEAYADLTTMTESFCLANGSYTLVIYDVFADGMCCAAGNGSYTLSLDGDVVHTGGQFTDTDVYSFTVN